MLNPPEQIGLMFEQAALCLANNTRVRYWPLVDAACLPHDAWVREVSMAGGVPVAWITGKTGFVLCSHLELAESGARERLKQAGWQERGRDVWRKAPYMMTLQAGLWGQPDYWLCYIDGRSGHTGPTPEDAFERCKADYLQEHRERIAAADVPFVLPPKVDG
jgi:hypothetical protein